MRSSVHGPRNRAVRVAERMGEAVSPGSSLLGRESELDLLDQLFDDVHARGEAPSPARSDPWILGSAQAPGSSPPTPAGSATPVMTIFGVPGEGERDDRRIGRVLSGFGS